MDEKKFISSWIQKLTTEKIKNFPDDFFVECEKDEYSLPGISLLIGQEIFGVYELIDATGLEVLKADSYEKAKYFFYGNRTKPIHISIPREKKLIIEMINNYEKHLDSVVKNIEQDYHQKFPASKNFPDVLNKIFKHLNLVRL